MTVFFVSVLLLENILMFNNSLGLKTRVKRLLTRKSGIYQEPYTVFIFLLRTEGEI